MAGPVALSASAASAARGRRRGAAGHSPLVRPQRPDPLPRAARARAVLRRRLGHARRVPGAGRAAARARPLGAAARPAAARLRATRTPTATGRSGSCSSSANATSAPATRTATSSSGRCSRSRSTCWPPTTRSILDAVVPFFDPDGDRPRGARHRVGARRARARGHRGARHPGHAPRGVRPRRLERLAAARRPGDARATVQRLDRHAAPPDARHARGGAAAPRHGRMRRRRWTRAAAQVRADFQRVLLADGDARRLRATSTPTGASSTCCTRATATPASTTGCCR